jgi:hypothetical protein
MRSSHVKALLMGAWIVAVGAFGYVFGATSVAAWIALAVLSLAPPAVVAWLWKAPAPSTSETIREALR